MRFRATFDPEVALVGGYFWVKAADFDLMSTNLLDIKLKSSLISTNLLEIKCGVEPDISTISSNLVENRLETALPVSKPCNREPFGLGIDGPRGHFHALCQGDGRYGVAWTHQKRTLRGRHGAEQLPFDP